MSERGADFLIAWIPRNINPDDYPPHGDEEQARLKAQACLAEAEAAGLSREELEAEVGPLAAYIKVMMSTPGDPAVRAGPIDASVTLH
ncbi:MAG: hypothetical protein JWR08_2617 [Enterovirga sp.]|jgi:hypothetical protein|nr:hypothetical protein [Enterovirga sp.]